MQVGQYQVMFFDGEGDRLDEWVVGRCTSIHWDCEKGTSTTFAKVKTFYRDTLDNKKQAEDLAEVLNQEFINRELLEA